MSETQISTDPSKKGNANLIYILYLAGFVTGGITAIIGLVMAYMAKSDAPDMLVSHYNNQINIFWKAFLYAIVGAITTFILIGFLIILFALIWQIVRIVKGMQALSKDEAIANPGSWGF